MIQREFPPVLGFSVSHPGLLHAKIFDSGVLQTSTTAMPDASSKPAQLIPNCVQLANLVDASEGK